MGTLVIMSGPSCVGKGPLQTTLEYYLTATERKLKKHVLYNSRYKREGEKHRETYWYSYLWNLEENDRRWDFNDIPYEIDKAELNLIRIMKKALKGKNLFEIFIVRDTLQGINYTELEKDLNDFPIVLLEIHQTKVDDVVTFCNRNLISLKRIFVSPISKEEYDNCSTIEERNNFIKTEMLKKLDGRATEKEEEREKRANGAIEEVDDAIKELKSNGERNVKFLVNRNGEDKKKEWKDLQKRVSDCPENYENGNKDSLHAEIDRTFKKFLEQIFPEIPNHVCGENLDVCTCRICGNRQHGKKYNSEGNYGSGCGSVVETCERCGAWERYDDATGNIISRSSNW